MSWSVRLIGTPEKVAEALDKESEKLGGQSKQEFDDAKPHLQELVKQNVGSASMLIDLSANGHATFVDGKKTQGTVQVELRHTYATYLV